VVNNLLLEISTIKAIGKATQEQIRALYGKAYGKGWDKDRITSFLEERFGTKEGNELVGKIDKLELSRVIDEIGGAIYELADAFRFAHAEEMWYAEKQLDVLTGIHDMAENRLATEANERYRQGMNSLSVGRLDDALIAFKAAMELNMVDYRIHIAMGHTYIGKDDLSNALESFNAAYDYARTNYYKSYALLLIARAKYCMGKIEEATKDAKRAVELSPDYAEAHYQYAVYDAQRLQRRLR